MTSKLMKKNVIIRTYNSVPGDCCRDEINVSLYIWKILNFEYEIKNITAP